MDNKERSAQGIINYTDEHLQELIKITNDIDIQKSQILASPSKVWTREELKSVLMELNCDEKTAEQALDTLDRRIISDQYVLRSTTGRTLNQIVELHQNYINALKKSHGLIGYLSEYLRKWKKEKAEIETKLEDISEIKPRDLIIARIDSSIAWISDNYTIAYVTDVSPHDLTGIKYYGIKEIETPHKSMYKISSVHSHVAVILKQIIHPTLHHDIIAELNYGTPLLVMIADNELRRRYSRTLVYMGDDKDGIFGFLSKKDEYGFKLSPHIRDELHITHEFSYRDIQEGKIRPILLGPK